MPRGGRRPGAGRPKKNKDGLPREDLHIRIDPEVMQALKRMMSHYDKSKTEMIELLIREHAEQLTVTAG